MRLPGWLWLSSAVLAACRAAEKHNLTEGLEDASAQAACPARLEGSGRCEGSQCPFQLTLPTLTLQLPQQFGSMEEVLKEVRTLQEAVDSLKKSCQDCKLQADEHPDPGGNGAETAEDNRVQELESQVNKLSSELKNAKEEIQGLQGRLESLQLVNMNNIENYVDNKVANLTSVVNSLDSKCFKCPSQEHNQPNPVQHLIYKDCSDYYVLGKRSSGTYRVTPDHRNSSFEVYCDMETTGGGWTVLQARLDGSTNFTRGWKDYKAGFGNLEREFWLGNDKIHLLTKSKEMILRIDLEDFNGLTLYAVYDQFYVANEFLKYRLHLGNYNGTAGDALRFSRHYNHDLRFFTTPDRDNDRYPSGNCGLYYSSGWWFDACLSANLNGKYYHQRYKGVRNGIFWGTWPGVSQAHPGGYKFSFKKAKPPTSPSLCPYITGTPSSFPFPSSQETGEEKRGSRVVMTELQAKDPRTLHTSGAAPSPTHVGSPLLARLDPDPFQGSQHSDASSVVSPIPISLDRLLFSRSCQAQELPDEKTQNQQSLSDVEGAFSGVEAARAEGSRNPRAPEKDSRLLDSVLDTLLAPSGPEQSQTSPPACEAITSWCLFGPELPEDPRSVPATKGLLSPLMSRPESKAGDSSGTGAGQKVLPKGLSPPRQLLLPTSGSAHWPGAGVKPSQQPATVEVEEDGGLETEGSAGPLLKSKPRALEGMCSGGGVTANAPAAAPGGVTLVPKEDSRFSAPRVSLEQDAPVAPGRSPLATTVVDFIHVPILPLNHALLAARTRQLLEGDSYDGGAAAQVPFAPPRGSPSAPSPPVPCGDFPDCTYPPEGDPKEDGFPVYGEFQPPGLKIKEEEEGTEAASRSPRPYLLAGASAATFPDFPLPPAPPRAPPSRPGEAAVAGGPGSAAVSPVSSSGSALECILYKAEGAPPTQGSFAPLPCKPPAASSCLLPRDSLPAAPTSSAAPAIYPPLGLNGLPQLGYQAAVLKDSLPQVYPPYLNYLRPDSEASQSPQYGFDSLPQKICLICGDEASGCHYGVLTCGSCKVFFKRAMEGQHNYLCAGRNDCIVDKIRRKNCPACRLRKCCQAGMVLGGRKFKKFNKVRVMRALDGVALPQSVGLPNESQTLGQRITFSPNQEIQLVPPLINLLMSIEPDVVYAGHDNTKPDTSSSLLTSLNQLGERQLLSVVKWSKSLPGFRNLHIDDQITLIQYSWMSLMVFGLGWRSYKHVSGQMLYFAPDLILNEQRMKELSFYSLCLTMWQIPQEFVKLQVTHEEFLCMKVLLLLNTIPLEGLRSQSQFEEMRSSYIRELIKAIGLRQKGVVPSSQRFYQLTKLLDSLHDLVKQLHLYCLNTFIQSRALAVEFPEMMSEVIAAQLPKILAGMVKPLLFHKK